MTSCPYEKDGIVIHEFQESLNHLAGTSGLDAQAAAQKWAGSNKDLLGALNDKNHSYSLGLNLVCNALAGTVNREAQDALSHLAYGTP